MEEELRRLISENKVIPFVGAGVSMDVKYKDGSSPFPSWKKLLNDFIEVIDSESKKDVVKALLADEPIDYLEIADKIEKSVSTNDFNKQLKKSIDVNYNEINEDTYALPKAIWSLGSKLIITTNYDKVLHNACDDKNIQHWDIQSLHEQGNFLRDKLQGSTVWNLHGHVDNIDNIILTSEKYNKLYTDNITDSQYKASLQVLQNILSSYSLLFIGFSLEDEFIVNQIKKVIKTFSGNSCEHYLLVKKGSFVNTLNNNIKVIEYEDYGKPLIEKLCSLKPVFQNTTQQQSSISIQSLSTKSLTTLPAINSEFIGRINELKEIERHLSSNSLVYVVNGIGGVGKSDLSQKYLHENKDKYNNIAFIELTENTSSIEELFYIKFKDEFHLDEHSTFDTVIKKLQDLSGKNLLLLDNLEKKEDFEKVKVLNINFDILITTRSTDLDVRNQLVLDTLNNKDAKELFLSIFSDEGKLDDILIYLDNHPLFIHLTAKSLKLGYISLDELYDNIKNNTISKIDSTDDKTFQSHLQDTFDKQFTNEGNDEYKELLQILAIFPSIEISYKVLEKSINIENLRFKLSKLAERGWLIKKENSYKLHQIIKTFILSSYFVEYNNITFILNNIAKYIDPEDSALIVSELTHYIPIIESFLILFESKNDKFIAGLLDSITYLYYAIAQFKRSLEYQKRSLNIKEKLFGEKDKYTATSYNLLAVIYQAMGKSNKSLPLYKKTLEIRESVLGENHLITAQSYNNLGTFYVFWREYEKALPLYEKALKIRKKTLGENDLEVAHIYHNIGSLYINKKEYEKAFPFIEKSLNIRESKLGNSHPVTANSYTSLALFYKNEKKYDKVLPLLEKALSINEIRLGKNHPDTAECYNNIAVFYDAIKKNKIALPFYEKALRIKEEVLGENHPRTALGYSNIALAYLTIKECLKAKRYMIQAIKSVKQLNNDHPTLKDYEASLISIEKSIKKQKKSGYRKAGKYCIAE